MTLLTGGEKKKRDSFRSCQIYYISEQAIKSEQFAVYSPAGKNRYKNFR